MQLLDLILVVIMLVSGLLALMRGFTREVLSLFAWVVAAAAAWWAVQMPALVEIARGFIANDKLAIIVTGAAVFLLVLLVMSVISVKIGDWVLDSAVGPFDRTLGGIFGVLRGLVLVSIAYMFYVWLVPEDRRAEWIEKARLQPLVNGTARVITDFIPPDMMQVMREKLGAEAEQPGDGTGAAAIGRGDRTRLDNLLGSGQKGR